MNGKITLRKLKRFDKAEVTKYNPWIEEGAIVTVLQYVEKGTYLVCDTSGDRWYINSRVLTIVN